MRRILAAACIAALALLAPTALASSGLVAPALTTQGSTALTGDATALFFVSQTNGFSWDATASRATLVREYAAFRALQHPLAPENYLHASEDEWQDTTAELTDVILRSIDTGPGGAMLATGDAAAIDARSSGLVQIRSAVDPVLAQDEAADAEAESGQRSVIEERFFGEFVEVNASDGTFTLSGELTLVMFGPAYELASAEDTTLERTGEYESSATAYYREGRQERHTLTLHDAVLHVRAMEPLTLLTKFPQLVVDGTLRATDAQGALVVGTTTIAAPADGSPLVYTGRATLALSAESGRIAVAAPAPLATAAAIAPQAPPLLAIGAGITLLLAAALGAMLFLRNRRAQADDLELALLAMNERRWNDALPRLARLAKRDPTNAGVLIDRALCLDQVGRLGEAARDFEAALRTAPRHAEAHFYYARTLAKMSQREAARAHLEAALERDPRLVEMARNESILLRL